MTTNELLMISSIQGAIDYVCEEMGLSSCTHIIGRAVTNLLATIITSEDDDDDTIILYPCQSDEWIKIIRGEYYLSLCGDQTLFFGAILRGTMGLDLSYHDNPVSEITGFKWIMEKIQTEWYAIAWGNDHMPTTFSETAEIAQALGRPINPDIEFDDSGAVSATTVLELTPSEVHKLMELDFVWHVEPVAEPK